MADRLTQLQDALDQLLTQMFASITYIDTRHPASSIPPQVDQHTITTSNSSTTPAQTEPSPFDDPDTRYRPQPAPAFRATLHELAQDLVVKQAQIEALIDSLPGLGNSQAQQEARIEELEAELKEVEGQRDGARREREELLGRVEGRILGARRV